MMFLHGEENSVQKEIKYFLDTTGIYGGIENETPVFTEELDKNLHPLKDTRFFSYINGLEKIIYANGKKGVKEEIPLSYFYKVYYENNIQRKAEQIKLSGYTYVKGVLHIDKNATKTNLGVVCKFDDKGRGIYRYSFETGEVFRTYYGIQYEDVTYISDNKTTRTKRYYEYNKLKISIYYENNVLLTYGNVVTMCDKEGKRINHKLEYMQKLYNEHIDTFSNKKKKFFQNMIKEEEEKIKNIPDLNLTLEQKYIDKIDRLNGR